ncbi:MAG TPA: isochorismate synthase [Acidimicrobiales bacterium]
MTRVVTRRLDGEPDLVHVAGRDGVLFTREGTGLAGHGVAARLSGGPDEVMAALASFEVDDEVGRPGCGPVAFGALPYDRRAPWVLTVPEVVVGRDPDGTAWVTTVGDAEPAWDEAPAAEDLGPSTFSVRPCRPPGEWCDAVAAATAEIRARRLTKVVLAREVHVEGDRPFDRPTVLRRLRAAYPSAMVVAADGMVGASPELLVSRAGDLVRSHPMAGTAPRSADPTTDARLAAGLLSSAKDRSEHQITIDMVHDTLLPWCSYLDAEAEPSVVALANVQHLATLVHGRLSAPAPSVLELVAALHPTPAVCGWPREEADALLARLEGFDRGRYAGPVGWVDAAGNGRFAVGVRTAALEGATARVFAGNGIVADSDPATELAETRAKLQALLSVLVRP